MATTVDLLSRGYFPSELPPAFQTDIFGSTISNSALAFPASFTDQTKTSKVCVHNLARPVLKTKCQKTQCHQKTQCQIRKPSVRPEY